MNKVVKMAKERGVMVGAHPGYPDLMGFGRRKMVLSFEEVKNYVRYQIGALSAFTQSYGMKLQHVAPHGAMGNQCQYDEEISTAIVEAIAEFDKDLIVYYCAGAVLGQIAESKGLRTASEIFADRAYMDDLSLVPRKMEGSMITDEDVAIARCVRMIKEGKVTSINGKELDIMSLLAFMSNKMFYFVKTIDSCEDKTITNDNAICLTSKELMNEECEWTTTTNNIAAYYQKLF